MNPCPGIFGSNPWGRQRHLGPQSVGEEGHKYLFRECYDSRMAAKVTSAYLKKNFGGKKFFYITADAIGGKALGIRLRAGVPRPG